jgi:prophage antirepressor-like protein
MLRAFELAFQLIGVLPHQSQLLAYSCHSLSATREVWYVNESGLCAHHGQPKPEAKRFKHWVTSEVLPEIRKTGLVRVYPGQYPCYAVHDHDDASHRRPQGNTCRSHVKRQSAE